MPSPASQRSARNASGERVRRTGPETARPNTQHDCRDRHALVPDGNVATGAQPAHVADAHGCAGIPRAAHEKILTVGRGDREGNNASARRGNRLAQAPPPRRSATRRSGELRSASSTVPPTSSWQPRSAGVTSGRLHVHPAGASNEASSRAGRASGPGPHAQALAPICEDRAAPTRACKSTPTYRARAWNRNASPRAASAQNAANTRNSACRCAFTTSYTCVPDQHQKTQRTSRPQDAPERGEASSARSAHMHAPEQSQEGAEQKHTPGARVAVVQASMAITDFPVVQCPPVCLNDDVQVGNEEVPRPLVPDCCPTPHRGPSSALSDNGDVPPENLVTYDLRRYYWNLGQLPPAGSPPPGSLSPGAESMFSTSELSTPQRQRTAPPASPTTASALMESDSWHSTASAPAVVAAEGDDDNNSDDIPFWTFPLSMYNGNVITAVRMQHRAMEVAHADLGVHALNEPQGERDATVVFGKLFQFLPGGHVPLQDQFAASDTVPPLCMHAVGAQRHHSLSLLSAEVSNALSGSLSGQLC